MKIFRTAGEELEKRWCAAQYDEAAFPDLAAEVLSESGICESVSAWDLLDWSVGQTELPVQRDLRAGFGDPPITLFNGPRFHIDVYYWLEGTTALHQHSFCGAFQVFHGSSIHSQYKFETERELNFFARTGKLSLLKCELFEKGAIQKIAPGKQYIHSLFHLDQPSATIVARTSHSPLEMPQFSYFKPGLAVDPFFESPDFLKKLQMITVALRAGNPKADELIEALLSTTDYFGTYQALQTLRPFLRKKSLKQVFGLEAEGDRFERFVSFAEERHGIEGNLLTRVFEESLRTEKIVTLRSVITESEHRFFLALLLNVEGAGNVLGLIKDRFRDDDPMDKLLDWVSELGNTRIIDGSFPNGLGIEGFDDFDTAVLEELLQTNDHQTVVRNMQGESVDQVAEERVRASIDKIEESVVLKRLLK